MENLLAMPVRPLEVMLGKIIPYVGLGYVQVLLILGVSVARVRRAGARLGAALLLVLGLFIASNLALGFTILDRCADADAGAATGAVRLAAVVHAVGLHVSRSRECRSGRAPSVKPGR